MARETPRAQPVLRQAEIPRLVIERKARLEVLYDMGRSPRKPTPVDDVINALRRAGLRHFATQATVLSTQ